MKLDNVVVFTLHLFGFQSFFCLVFFFWLRKPVKSCQRPKPGYWNFPLHFKLKSKPNTTLLEHTSWRIQHVGGSSFFLFLLHFYLSMSSEVIFMGYRFTLVVEGSVERVARFFSNSRCKTKLSTYNVGSDIPHSGVVSFHSV